jgi:hypothetical protein
MKGARPDTAVTIEAERNRTGESAKNKKKASSRSQRFTIRQKSTPSGTVRDLRFNLTELSERSRSFIAFTTISDERRLYSRFL